MSEEQDDETSDNDTMGGRGDPFVLVKVRAKHVIKCWYELTTTTHQRAFAKTARAMDQLEDAIADYEAERLGQANDQLVVENDALRAELDLWKDGNIIREEDRKELIALRADKERLDWLTNSLGWIVVGNVNEADPSQHAKEGDTLADAWRAAIDDARKEAQP